MLTFILTAILNLLIFGLVVNWILSFFVTPNNPEFYNFHKSLDNLYKPLLDPIKNIIKPLDVGNNVSIDFSPAILIGILYLVKLAVYIIL
ncbi:MAG: YggT family protein [Leptospiraceae bacterium]|nr:YggT family protein [Leptospiraceae bacterium]MCP5497581.1 YggT family protein [Leptospiraceae bacterium]